MAREKTYWRYNEYDDWKTTPPPHANVLKYTLKVVTDTGGDIGQEVALVLKEEEEEEVS